MFAAQFRRELALARRSLPEIANPLVFFAMVTSLLPLALGADAAQWRLQAAGLIWVMALLSCLLSLDGLFRSDYDDGSLDQLLLLPQGLFWIVLAKILVHWMFSGLLLALMAPLLAAMLGLPAEIDGVSVPLLLVASLFAGTLYFSFIGAIGAALTVCLRRGGILLSLVVMPLYIPALVFGSGAFARLVQGFDIAAPLAVLAALAALAIALAPPLIVAALRIGADN